MVDNATLLDGISRILETHPSVRWLGLTALASFIGIIILWICKLPGFIAKKCEERGILKYQMADQQRRIENMELANMISTNLARLFTESSTGAYMQPRTKLQQSTNPLPHPTEEDPKST